MAKSDTYSRARKIFEKLDFGERITALELANRVGVTNYEEKKKVAAFLSQQAQKGRVKKHLGEGKRMSYEKVSTTRPSRAAKRTRATRQRKDSITYGEIGEGIVNYIEKLKGRIGELEKRSDELKEKLKVFSNQKEEFKRLYQEAEARVKELSAQQPAAQKTIRLTKVVGK
jgi:hypothetical protein